MKSMELEEKLSETIVNDVFTKWVHSYRDLPLIINQWENALQEEPMAESKGDFAEEPKEDVNIETGGGESSSWHLNGLQPKAVMDSKAEFAKHMPFI
ncbi:hypothetical protein SUGI_0210430 [Cryptomeria japonica]|nr:hypothetical protein SUGI_0210430 [Cryptomeria japonica]